MAALIISDWNGKVVLVGALSFAAAAVIGATVIGHGSGEGRQRNRNRNR